MVDEYLLSRYIDGTARVWDVEKGETILGSIETAHKWVYAIVYSPDMTMFAAGGRQPALESRYY
jgi:WD40 repeat protein